MFTSPVRQSILNFFKMAVGISLFGLCLAVVVSCSDASKSNDSTPPNSTDGNATKKDPPLDDPKVSPNAPQPIPAPAPPNPSQPSPGPQPNPGPAVPPPVNPPSPPKVTWPQISSIINEKCTCCHKSGTPKKPEIASYDTAKVNSSMIKQDISDGSMPPSYYGISLTDYEKNLVMSWYSDGMMP